MTEDEYNQLRPGDQVVATMKITEGGEAPDLLAKFPSPRYIHAFQDNDGVVEGVDDGTPTVRFWPRGTSTVVGPHEIVTREAHRGTGG